MNTQLFDEAKLRVTTRINPTGLVKPSLHLNSWRTAVSYAYPLALGPASWYEDEQTDNPSSNTYHCVVQLWLGSLP